MPFKTFTTKPQAVKALEAVKLGIDMHVSDNISIRKCCEVVNPAARRVMAPSTLHKWARLVHLLRIEENKKGFFITYRGTVPQTAFTFEEEKVLLSKVLDILSKKEIVTKEVIRDIGIQMKERILCGNNNEDSRKRLRKCKLGEKWNSSLVKRHSNSISLRRPLAVDGKKYIAFNMENVTSYFAKLYWVLHEYKTVSPAQIYNLDETGFSPDRDLPPEKGQKVLSLPKQRRHLGAQQFRYRERISVIACCRADGKNVEPTLVFKGEETPNYQDNRIWYSVENILSADYVCEARVDRGGVNTEVFIRWSHRLAEYVKNKHEKNEKVLLLLDGYRCHLSRHALETLKAANIVVFVLPAHCSHMLQPLDVSCFRSVKYYSRKYVNERYSSLVSHTSTSVPKLEMSDIVKSIHYGFENGITKSNIVSGFKKCGISPFDCMGFNKFPIRKSPEDDSMIAMESFTASFEGKKDYFQSRYKEVSMRRGYIDSQCGALLTPDEAFALMRQNANNAVESLIESAMTNSFAGDANDYE